MSTLEHVKACVRSAILPRPPSAVRTAGLPGPLVVAGMFRTGNGIGRAARCCHDALIAEGLAPCAVDISEILNQANIASSVPTSEFPLAQHGTLILFVNPPEVERCLMALGLRRWHRWRIVGAWAWETTLAPADWVRQTKFVSEIWAPSQFCADAFSDAYAVPVLTVPHYVSSEPVATRANDLQILARGPGVPGEKQFNVLTIADARSSLQRKNPLAAVQIFRAALPDAPGARLTLKCRDLKLYPDYLAALEASIGEDRRIAIVDDTLPDAMQTKLVDDCDVILSPHRSEGFGLHLAEAMARGKCVVATGWSGNLEYMTEGNSVLLPFKLTPVSDPTGVYSSVPGALWAEPDIEASAGVLRKLYEDRERQIVLGQSARYAIARTLRSAPYRGALEMTSYHRVIQGTGQVGRG